MAAILADDNFKCIFWNENDGILIQISLKFVTRSPIDNMSALVQVMAWHQTGDKTLPELMPTQFIDAPAGDELMALHHQLMSHYLNQCWSDMTIEIAYSCNILVGNINTE